MKFNFLIVDVEFCGTSGKVLMNHDVREDDAAPIEVVVTITLLDVIEEAINSSGVGRELCSKIPT